MSEMIPLCIFAWGAPLILAVFALEPLKKSHPNIRLAILITLGVIWAILPTVIIFSLNPIY